MKPFSYYKPANVAQAVSLLAQHGENAALLAGGSDLIARLKDRVEGPRLKAPAFLVDVKGIRELNGVREERGVLRIGAATPVADIAGSELVAQRCPLLRDAAAQVAVPQIRNVGTLGGNLCQRPRCWYFRGHGFADCYRKGGGQCYAVGGENRYHAVIGGSKCFMVHPSDLAVALIALDATVQIASAKGVRAVPVERFYVGPEKKLTGETVLGPQEMVVGVAIPAAAAQAKSAYVKLKERQAFDFALVSVAVSVTSKAGVVEQARIAFGGLAPVPLRSTQAEAALKGRPVAAGIEQACRAATQGAQALAQNGYKIPAAAGVLEEALRQLG